MIALGRRVYGLAAVVLAIPALILGDFAALGLAPPAGLPARDLLAYASAGVLALAGVALNAPRTARAGALALAGFFAAWTFALHLPNALAKPTVWVSWEVVAEATATALGGLLAYALTPGADPAPAAVLGRLARPLFGVCLLVFGRSEYVYAQFTAAMVPDWLPPSPRFWTYATGAAQIAAGLAVLTGVQARLAAVLLTTMYLGFGVLVHLPRVIAAPTAPAAWAENGVNLMLAGAAWCLADSLIRPKAPPATAP
jgi:uncharacterized membrane protein YphA (DoxX/SURF4 family)